MDDQCQLPQRAEFYEPLHADHPASRKSSTNETNWHRAWATLCCLWFSVPAATYLDDTFYQKDVWHMALALAIAAAFPLSWHLSLVIAKPVCTAEGDFMFGAACNATGRGCGPSDGMVP